MATLAPADADSTRQRRKIDLGFEWTYKGTAGSSAYSLGTDFDPTIDMAKMSGLVGGMQGGDFSFLLRALKTQGKLHVLSRPQIVTADNKPANINIGQRSFFSTNTLSRRMASKLPPSAR